MNTFILKPFCTYSLFQTNNNSNLFIQEKRVIFDFGAAIFHSGPTCYDGNCMATIPPKKTKENLPVSPQLKEETKEVTNEIHSAFTDLRSRISETYKNNEDLKKELKQAKIVDFDGDGVDDFVETKKGGSYNISILKDGALHSAITGEPAQKKVTTKIEDFTQNTPKKIDSSKLIPNTGVTAEMLEGATISILGEQTFVDLKDGTSYLYEDIFDENLTSSNANINPNDLENSEIFDENSKEGIIKTFNKIRNRATLPMIQDLYQKIQNLDEEERQDSTIKMAIRWARFFIKEEKIMIDKQEANRKRFIKLKKSGVSEKDAMNIILNEKEETVNSGEEVEKADKSEDTINKKIVSNTDTVEKKEPTKSNTAKAVVKEIVNTKF